MKLEDSGLKTDTHNANLGTQRGRGLLEKSLRNLGAGRSILADKNGNIIAGNKTLEGASEIDLPVRIVETDGKELVVVKRMDLDLYSDTDKRGRTLAYADNKIAELDLSWSPESIQADFEPLDLGAWGFQTSEPIDYAEAWQGMPEFEEKDMGAFRSLIVHFANQQDFDEFCNLIGQVITERARSIWHPKAEILHQDLVEENDKP